MALLFKRLYSCHTVWNHTLVWPASPSWYSWPSWGFFTLTQGVDIDFLVWLFRIKHPVYGYILHVGNVWESTWSIFLTYTWVWWHCLWTRGWERHRPILMETGRRMVILPLSLGDRLRVTLALKAWFSFNSIAQRKKVFKKRYQVCLAVLPGFSVSVRDREEVTLVTGVRVDKVKKSQTENQESASSILTLQFKPHHFNFHFRACLGSSPCKVLISYS